MYGKLIYFNKNSKNEMKQKQKLIDGELISLQVNRTKIYINTKLFPDAIMKLNCLNVGNTNIGAT